MNLAPLPFLPHTHRKETRFPSNRAGYISVFLGIGVAHDIGDVDTGFILKFSECIRKVCKKRGKKVFFLFKPSSIAHQLINEFVFSVFSSPFFQHIKRCQHLSRKKQNFCNFCVGPRLVFTQHRSSVHKSHGVLRRRAERREPHRADIFICHEWC